MYTEYQIADFIVYSILMFSIAVLSTEIYKTNKIPWNVPIAYILGLMVVYISVYLTALVVITTLSGISFSGVSTFIVIREVGKHMYEFIVATLCAYVYFEIVRLNKDTS